MNRGAVYEVRLPKGRGHEQRGRRYAAIVQADELLGLSTALVAPTSRAAASASFRPEIELGGETTRVLVEQTRAIDISRLGGLAGQLSPDERLSVDDALALVLGLV